MRANVDSITAIVPVLTIAGSDCSGGAGIAADLKTMCAHDTYGMSVITAITAQNTMGVDAVFDTPNHMIEKQLDCIFTDIYPGAVKLGMLSNKEIIQIVYNKLTQYKASNIVLDPVMISTSGHKLLHEDAIYTLVNKLLPIVDIVTPNIPEACELSKTNISSKEDMITAAKIISRQTNAAILIKGGHIADCADDLLYTNGEAIWFNKPQLNNPNTHGTGCTLSSAIACNLAKGIPLKKSVYLAKEYVYNAIDYGFNIGKGHGPLYHMFNKF